MNIYRVFDQKSTSQLDVDEIKITDCFIEMYGKPWLQPDDPLWSQQLLWNMRLDELLKFSLLIPALRHIAEKCPLIEEAQWFLVNVIDKSLDDSTQEAEIILKAGNTSRHQAYAGVLSDNWQMIRDAAINGDAMSQYHMSRVTSPEGEIYWLKKSLHGGYCKAFKRLALYYRNTLRIEEEQSCLEKGIAAGSASLITAYGKNRSLPEYNELYLTGRVWLLNSKRGRIFSRLVEYWYDNTEDYAAYHTKGFIIGQIVNRLPVETVTTQGFETHNRRRALTFARDIYLSMCDKTARAIYAWMLVSKQLGVMKDIRVLIAREIWMTRDQAPWA